MTAQAGGSVAAPEALTTMIDRFDAGVLRLGTRPHLLRLQVRSGASWDVELSRTRAVLRASSRRTPESGLLADMAVWEEVSSDARQAYRRFFDGSLRSRGSAHLGLGFLAATSGDERAGRLTWSAITTPAGRVSLLEGGTGEPLVCI